MPIKHNGKSPEQIIKEIMKLLQKTPRAVGQMAVQHFEENFEKGGFVDEQLQRWKPRKHRPEGIKRGVLIQSGRLSKSIRVIRVDRFRVTIGSDVKYARIHNEGGVTHPTVTPQMRAWAWRMYKATGQDRYKAIALTSKDRLRVKIPKRQFMGPSKELNKKINTWFNNELRIIFGI